MLDSKVKKILMMILLFALYSSFIKANYINSINSRFHQDTSTFKVKEIYYDNGNVNLMDITILETNVKLIWYENGKLKSRTQFYKGMPIGTFTQWYDNGQKMTEGVYLKYDDTTKSKWKSVTELEGFDTSINMVVKDSEVMTYISISYKYPRTGEWKYWYSNGQLKQISNYKEYTSSEKNLIEIKEGKWQFYNEQGGLVKEIIYKDDKIIK